MDYCSMARSSTGGDGNPDLPRYHHQRSKVEDEEARVEEQGRSGGCGNQALPGTERSAHRPQAGGATQRFPEQPKPQLGITESWIVGAVTEAASVA